MTRLTIPLQFDLLNRTWKVKTLTAASLREYLKQYPDEKGTKLEDLYGWCDKENAIVYLAYNKSKEHMMHTFLHEFGHAVFEALGWEMDDKEEAMVDGLGGAIHQLLKSKEGTFK